MTTSKISGSHIDNDYVYIVVGSIAVVIFITVLCCFYFFLKSPAEENGTKVAGKIKSILNFDNPSAKPKGIVNLSDSCYMNSVIQALAGSEVFCKVIKNCRSLMSTENIVLLDNIIDGINDGNKDSSELATNLKFFANKIGWLKSTQQDAFDFLSKVTNEVFNIFMINNRQPVPPKLEMVHIYTKPTFTTKVQNHLGFALFLIGEYEYLPGVNISSLIDAFFSTMIIDNDPLYNTYVAIYGTNPPPMLLLHIQANYWDTDRRKMIKPKYFLNYSEKMNISLKIWDPNTKLSKYIKALYKLQAVILHMGQINQGHYVTFRQYKNKWFLANDRFVEEKSKFQCPESPYILIYDLMEDVTVAVRQ